MPSFATGKKAYFISDRSGFRYPYSSMKIEWTGAAVGPDEFEPKHPQLNPRRHAADPQGLRLAKVDRTEPAVIQLLRPDCFPSSSSGSSVITLTMIQLDSERLMGLMVLRRQHLSCLRATQ